MTHEYPWYVPKPGTPGVDPKDKLLVHNPDQHQKANPEHFAAAQEAKKNPGAPSADVILHQVAAERERCARIAESEQRGNALGLKIAKKIRAGSAQPQGTAEPLADPRQEPTKAETESAEPVAA